MHEGEGRKEGRNAHNEVLMILGSVVASSAKGIAFFLGSVKDIIHQSVSHSLTLMTQPSQSSFRLFG